MLSPGQESRLQAECGIPASPVPSAANGRSHSRFDVVQEFTRHCASIDDMATLREAIAESSRALGFNYFALVHHIRFGRPSTDKIRLSNYPLEWLAKIREDERFDEPVLRAAERTSSGFLWSRLGDHLPLAPAQRQYMQHAARFGLAEGFTVPNHVPGETFGSCHFAVSCRDHLPHDNLPAAQALGTFAFEKARQIIEHKRQPSEEFVIPAPLTERQRDCLLFAAKGKSDTVIAQLLNIRPRTVNQHMEAAKRRYSVATRAQLIVRALFRSEIRFSEVL
jgi:LuxR family quorum-sensing system transcriptional regulator CciR